MSMTIILSYYQFKAQNTTNQIDGQISYDNGLLLSLKRK